MTEIQVLRRLNMTLSVPYSLNVLFYDRDTGIETINHSFHNIRYVFYSMTEIQVLRHYTAKSIIRTKDVLFYDRDTGIETIWWIMLCSQN